MKKVAIVFALALTLGLGLGFTGFSTAYAGPDTMISDAMVAQAAKTKVGERIPAPTKVEANKTITITMFIIIVLVTMYIVYWAAKRTKTTADFYAARGAITGAQNGWAIAGDYMSAASFLGIAGLICLYGYDGFMY